MVEVPVEGDADNDLVDSTCTPPENVVEVEEVGMAATVTEMTPPSRNEVLNEVSSTEGSIPEYTVDLKCVTSSSTNESISAPASASPEVSSVAEAAKTLSFDGNLKTLNSSECKVSISDESPGDDERQERINPKTSVEKFPGKSQAPFFF